MKREDFAAPRCPGTLKHGFTTYCPAVLRNMFEGRQVFHVLPDQPYGPGWEQAQTSLTFYGGQKGFFMKQVKNKLIPDKNGNFLLKTVFPGSSELRFPMEQTGNEHLCGLLANEVFEIETLPAVLIFFPDGQPAILYRYFPLMENFEDMDTVTTINGERQATAKNYHLMILKASNQMAATLIAKERYFRQVVFSWLLANGLAHGKNMGAVKTSRGDLIPSPLFQAMCTRLHELDSEIPVRGGLYEGDKNSPEFRENGYYSRNEFTSLGRRIGINEARIEKILDRFLSKQERALDMISNAFLPAEAIAVIRYNFQERISRLK